uniref:uncharacterized protein LOC120347808 n=1 Tax=Styela clava TaxID=7725 RepID=UPI00193A6C2B|nr:uncharacterized protein LOC120347808 [Styela clava]
MSYIVREDAPYQAGDLGNPQQQPPSSQQPMLPSLPQLVEAPFVPMVHVKAFKILGFLQAVGSFLILLCGIIILAASSSSNTSFGGKSVGGAAMVTGVVCGVSSAFGILNAFRTTECRAITGIVLSVFSAIGSSGISAFATSVSAVCAMMSYSANKMDDYGFRYNRPSRDSCPTPVSEVLVLLIIVSAPVFIISIVHSAFSCRAMCCLRPQQVVMVNNNLHQATKL